VDNIERVRRSNRRSFLERPERFIDSVAVKIPRGTLFSRVFDGETVMLRKLFGKLRDEQRLPAASLHAPSKVRMLASHTLGKGTRPDRRYIELRRRNWTPQSNQLSS
jgi:hypothetical protein